MRRVHDPVAEIDGGYDLVSTVDRALGWVARNLNEFDPLATDRRFDIPRMKRFTEMALMLSVYIGATGDTSRPAIRGPIELLAASLEEPRFFDWAMRSPAAMLQHLHLYTAYRTAVGESPAQRTLILRALDNGFDRFVERPPYRLMEFRMCMEWLELPDRGPSWCELLDRSTAASLPAALHLRVDDLYALTHVVMFATRIGLEPPDRFTPEQIARFEPLLSDLIIAMCQEGHWDLLGELLMCWDCLHLPSTPIVRRAWAAFVRMQAADGSLPPTSARDDHDADPATDEGRKQRVALRYHTTLVAIIAGSIRQRRLGQVPDLVKGAA